MGAAWRKVAVPPPDGGVEGRRDVGTVEQAAPAGGLCPPGPPRDRADGGPSAGRFKARPAKTTAQGVYAASKAVCRMGGASAGVMSVSVSLSRSASGISSMS